LFYLKYKLRNKKNILKQKLWYLNYKNKFYNKKINKNYNGNYFNWSDVQNGLDKKNYIEDIFLFNRDCVVDLVVFKFNKLKR